MPVSSTATTAGAIGVGAQPGGLEARHAAQPASSALALLPLHRLQPPLAACEQSGSTGRHLQPPLAQVAARPIRRRAARHQPFGAARGLRCRDSGRSNAHQPAGRAPTGRSRGAAPTRGAGQRRPRPSRAASARPSCARPARLHRAAAPGRDAAARGSERRCRRTIRPLTVAAPAQEPARAAQRREAGPPRQPRGASARQTTGRDAGSIGN